MKVLFKCSEKVYIFVIFTVMLKLAFLNTSEKYLFGSFLLIKMRIKFIA